MENAVFGSECGLHNIIVLIFHCVTDDLSCCGCIHHSVASILVEGRAYDVAITALEVPGPSCVGHVVYENQEDSRTNWGGILVKRSIEVLPD